MCVCMVDACMRVLACMRVFVVHTSECVRACLHAVCVCVCFVCACILVCFSLSLLTTIPAHHLCMRVYMCSRARICTHGIFRMFGRRDVDVGVYT